MNVLHETTGAYLFGRNELRRFQDHRIDLHGPAEKLGLRFGPGLPVRTPVGGDQVVQIVLVLAQMRNVVSCDLRSTLRQFVPLIVLELRLVLNILEFLDGTLLVLSGGLYGGFAPCRIDTFQ